MSKALLALGMLGVTGALSICELCPPGAARSAASLVSLAHAAAAEPKIVTLRVEGMTCGGCVIGVRKVLTRLDGVSKAEVSYETQRAVVTYDPAKVTIEQMIAAIGTLKYKATAVSG